MTRTVQFAALAFCCWFSFAGAACAQEKPSAIDPCSLLSAAEVSAAMGATVGSGRLTTIGPTRDGAFSTTCLWEVALPPGVVPDPTKSRGGRSFAILNVMNWAGGPGDPRIFLEGFRKAFREKAIGSEPVDLQIGADEALWWGDGVAARKGQVSFGISVASAGDRAARRPKAESLARLIVRRIGKSAGRS